MKIDFYVLENSTASICEQFACKLVEKIFHLNHRIYIHTDSLQQANNLDNLLWTHNQGSFLPHDIVTGSDNCNSPIALGYDSKLNCSYDVLVNLSKDVPIFCSQFNRIAEFVCADSSSKSLARNRFRQYQQLGYEIDTHHIDI